MHEELWIVLFKDISSIDCSPKMGSVVVINNIPSIISVDTLAIITLNRDIFMTIPVSVHLSVPFDN